MDIDIPPVKDTEKSLPETRLPSWARRPLGRPSALHKMKATLRQRGLHTVCESARCPNIGECFSKPTATFMIMGDVCTRNCGFCNVKGGASALKPNLEEPENIALTAAELKLKHVVITSVTRDDLPGGGASHFAETIRRIRELSSGITVEVLTPDFMGDIKALDTVLGAAPDVFNHNIETMPRLYPEVRPEADYGRSLGVLKRASLAGVFTKSGLMVGLGEDPGEVRQVLIDLSGAGCKAVTIGQYLRPSKKNIKVVRYVEPEVFKEYEAYGKEAGIEKVYAGPFVRSSYNAREFFSGSGA